MQGELRKDPATGKWYWCDPGCVIMKTPIRAPVLVCPGNEHLTPPEIASYRRPGVSTLDGWEVRVFPERDPYFVIEEDLVREGIGMFDRISTRGASEIVVESPDHGMTLQNADEAQIERMLWMYRDRVKDLKRDLKIRNVVVTRSYRKPGSRIQHLLLADPGGPDRFRQPPHRAHTGPRVLRLQAALRVLRHDPGRGCHGRPDDRDDAPFRSLVPYMRPACPSNCGSCREGTRARSRRSRPRRLPTSRASSRTSAGLLAKGIGDPSYEITLHTAPNLAVKIVQGEWDTIERDYHWHLEVLVEAEQASGGRHRRDRHAS